MPSSPFRFASEWLDSGLRSGKDEHHFLRAERTEVAGHDNGRDADRAGAAWMCFLAGATIAVASARGGGLKRHTAVTPKITKTINVSVTMARSSLRVADGSPAPVGAVRDQRFMEAGAGSRGCQAAHTRPQEP
ncbi:hypothetical protein [Brucella intermedia]|uniref:hypothetical protein n=1 Tax=Brucella intermedia TaxID=94625 RepID=UPI002249A1C8|nr:hypothetical protein [Brucella intermedia]